MFGAKLGAKWSRIRRGYINSMPDWSFTILSILKEKRMYYTHSPRASGLRSNKFPLRELRILAEHFALQDAISYKVKKNPALQDSPPAAGRFATDFIPAAVR